MPFVRHGFQPLDQTWGLPNIVGLQRLSIMNTDVMNDGDCNQTTSEGLDITSPWISRWTDALRDQPPAFQCPRNEWLEQDEVRMSCRPVEDYFWCSLLESCDRCFVCERWQQALCKHHLGFGHTDCSLSSLHPLLLSFWCTINKSGLCRIPHFSGYFDHEEGKIGLPDQRLSPQTKELLWTSGFCSMEFRGSAALSELAQVKL